MRISFSKTLSSALVLAALVAYSPRALRAGDEDDKKKQEKEWKKLEEQQKKGGQKPGEKGDGQSQGQGEGQGQGQQGQGQDAENPLGDNPLGKILDLMKEVESRVNDADLDNYTQQEQKKIVEAMKFEDKAKTALDDLIKKLEDMQNQGGGGGGGGEQQSEQQKQQQQSQQQKNETPQQRQERERKERQQQKRDKEEEEKRQRNNPQQMKQQKDQQNQSKADQKKQKGKIPPDQRSPLDPKQGDANRWGDLPAKLHSDAEKARESQIPERWRDQIERYREATSE